MLLDDLIDRGLLRMVAGQWVIDDGEKRVNVEAGSDYYFDTIRNEMIYTGDNK